MPRFSQLGLLASLLAGLHLHMSQGERVVYIVLPISWVSVAWQEDPFSCTEANDR